MRRREFIALVGGKMASPLVVRAQHQQPVIGFLSSVSARAVDGPVMAFRQGLKEFGYVEGQNLTIEYRWSEGQGDRLPELCSELIRRNVAVIVATGGGASALAAKAATPSIPIVFSTAADPVKLGLVSSLNQPGGNMTGVFILATILEGKRLGLLHDLIPRAKSIAILANPNTPGVEDQLQDARSAARTIGIEIHVLEARNESEINTAFAILSQVRAEALLVAADPFFNAQRLYLVTLAARHVVPAIFEFREFAAVGGLMSYGTDLADAYRQVGIYVGRILKGDKPADLPVVQPTKFELVINLKTAKALGITVPPLLLAQADEVIE
jgi:ABC-type uncharacterized transport system substrate-binding protein